MILSSYEPLLILFDAVMTLDIGDTILSANFKPKKVDSKTSNKDIITYIKIKIILI